MEEFHLVSIEQAIISIIILIIIAIDLSRTFRRSMLRSRLLAFIVINIFYLTFNFIIDDINIYNSGSKFFIYSIWIIYYSLEISLRASLFLYMEYLMRSKISISTNIEYVCLIFHFITLFLIISTPFTHLLFYVGKDLKIVYMPLYFLVDFTSYFYLIISVLRGIYCAIITPNKRERRIYILMLIFLALPYVTLFSKLDLWDGTTAISILIFYLIIQHENISKDPLTNLNDRTYLNQDIEKMLVSNLRKRTALLMIDGDHFKQINDNYGHLEGDKSLIRLAKAITEGTKNLRFVSTARYGGDEFVVCFIESYDREAEVVASRISSKLKELNIMSNSGYEFNVSIGIAKYDDTIKNAKDFIKAADAKLYDIKNSRENK